MKPKYSIGLFVFVITIIYLISATLPAERKNETNDSYTSPEISVTNSNEILNSECFYLRISNGFIVVYNSDNKTIYEYTDIFAEDLPDKLYQELKNGKFIESKEELYGFLENYSS